MTTGGSSRPPRWSATALYHPGRTAEDAAPDIGDSAVLELVGLGGAAAAGSPAVGQLVGGMAAAAALTERAGPGLRRTLEPFHPADAGWSRDPPRRWTCAASSSTAITPKVTTGILHARDGSGQIGAGVAEAPLSCFRDALLDLDARLS